MALVRGARRSRASRLAVSDLPRHAAQHRAVGAAFAAGGEHAKAILELPTLLQQPIADPPTVEAQVARARLQSLVCDLLHRRSEPILILKICTGLRLTASRSCRACCPMPSAIPWLSWPAIATMKSRTCPKSCRYQADAAAAAESAQHRVAHRVDAGQHNVRPDLLAWLRDQTEGNPFFLVEILRTLADEAGSPAAWWAASAA